MPRSKLAVRLALLPLLFVVFAGDSSPAQDDGPTAPVLAFIASLESLDVEAAMANFTDDATAFFPHTGLPDRLDGWQQIHEMMAAAYEAGRRRAAAAGIIEAPYQKIAVADMKVQDVSPGVAVVTWHAHDDSRKARRSAVVQRRDGEWKIVNLHSSNIHSAVPQGASDGTRGATASPLADPTRPPEDLERDPGSKPLEVFAWLGISEGMAVGDLVPFGGYNTHLLSRVVGPQGTVYAVYNIARQKPAFDERMANAELNNVVELADLSSVADDSVDAYLTVRNMHDFFIPEIVAAVDLTDAETVFREALRTLKPGAILGVVDARTDKEGVDPETHRINEAKVVADLESLGFELVDRSELLADPTDDYGASNFPVRWNNDRFLLKFRKPRSGSSR